MSADEIRDVLGWNAVMGAEGEALARLQVLALGEIAAQLARLNDQVGEQVVRVDEAACRGEVA